jgi:hypothetical protein
LVIPSSNSVIGFGVLRVATRDVGGKVATALSNGESKAGRALTNLSLLEGAGDVHVRAQGCGEVAIVLADTEI